MEAASAAGIIVVFCTVIIGTGLFWRYVWFFRNPPRNVPPGECIVSPADGTVVYVKIVQPGEKVIAIKEGVEARIEDIVKEDICCRKLLIGIFMSPFDVHYNRAPIAGKVESIRHYPAGTKNIHMTSMHYRTLFGIPPFYKNSLHIIENERSVTRIGARFKGEDVRFYVVQIGGGSVNGIDSYVSDGEELTKGQIFGMIRIGSQVDLVTTFNESMKIRVRAGDKVFAGESIIVE